MQQDNKGNELTHPTGRYALNSNEWKLCWLEAEGVKSIAMKNYHAQDLTEDELERLSVVVNPERKENVKRLKKILQEIKQTLKSPTQKQKELLMRIENFMKLERYGDALSLMNIHKEGALDEHENKVLYNKNPQPFKEITNMTLLDDHAELMRHTFKIDDTIFVLSGGSDRFEHSLKVLQNDDALKKAFPSGYVRLHDNDGGHWTSKYWDGKQLYNDKTLKDRVKQDGINCGLFALHEGMLLAKIYRDVDTYKKEDIKKDKEDFCTMMVAQAKYNNNKAAEQAGNWRVGTVVLYPQLQLTLKNKPIITKEVNPKWHNEDRNFYFSYLNSEGESEAQTAYIDKNYHHYQEYNKDANYKLQTTIDKHTEIITNGLIDAYNEIYGAKKANFNAIESIWKEAQDEEKWNEVRAKDVMNRTADEIQMLRFSAKFQKIMANAGLMTGNPNATNFVGMRLKRVSKCHINALNQELASKHILGSLSASQNNQQVGSKGVSKESAYKKIPKLNNNKYEKIRIY